VSVIVFLLVAILLFVLFNRLLPLLAGLIISLAIGTMVGLGVRLYFRRIRAEAARPEKKAILASTQLVKFSWRATTFEFENEEFSDRVEELNQEKLMEL
jgi:predicted Na+-dependent transporter